MLNKTTFISDFGTTNVASFGLMLQRYISFTHTLSIIQRVVIYTNRRRKVGASLLEILQLRFLDYIRADMGFRPKVEVSVGIDVVAIVAKGDVLKENIVLIFVILFWLNYRLFANISPVGQLHQVECTVVSSHKIGPGHTFFIVFGHIQS